MTHHHPNQAESTLSEVMVVMEQLVVWLIRAGVGYTEFSSALKPVFFRQALLEIERLQGKQTDSAISLLSGLHRRDVHAFREALHQDNSLRTAKVSQPVSVPARVIGAWLATHQADQLPLTGEQSFEALVRSISHDVHPRAVMAELERLGVLRRDDEQVLLERRAFMPDPQAQEAKALLAANVADHLAAGVANLTTGQPQQLEQAVFADELTLASIERLERLGVTLWNQCAQQLLQVAVEACAQDEGKPDATYRYRFGSYQYRAPFCAPQSAPSSQDHADDAS